MYKLLLNIFIFSVLVTCSNAQGRAVQNIQQSEILISSSSYGLYFRGYNGSDVTLDNNGKPKLGGLDLESIPGQLYWNNTYGNAKLFLKEHKLLGEFKVRFEQLNQIFYVLSEKDNSVKVVDPAVVEHIEFTEKILNWDTPIFRNTFNDISSKTKDLPNGYLQELVRGAISLFKMNKSIIRYQDSLFGAIKKPYLVPQHSYYIFYKGDFKEIKKLSYKNLASAFPFLDEEMKRMNINKSDLDTESKIIILFDQMNLYLTNKEKK